jgi:outer membrane protein assembly factor BamB
MNLDALQKMVIENEPMVRHGLFILGIAIIVFGGLTFVAKRWKRKPIPRREGISLLVLILLGGSLSVATRFTIGRKPDGSLTLTQVPPPILPVDQVNEAALAKLKTDSLASSRQILGPPDAWPQWLGPSRDGIATDTGLLTDWSRRPPTIVWKQSLGRGYSSPAVVGERLYVTEADASGKNEHLLCMDAATGKTSWTHSYRIKRNGGGGYAGPRATPTVCDGKVYWVGYDGQFLCLDANPADGKPKVLWQHDLLTEFGAGIPMWGVACSPLIEGDLVIVQPGGKAGSVAAFDRRSGKLAWKSLAEPSGYSSPVAATAAGARQIVCFTGKSVAGLDPANGNLLWQYPWQTEYDANIATPVIAGDYVFISSGYGTGCALLHLAATEGGIKADAVYVKRNKLMRNHHMTCILHDGFLYGCDSGNGELKCIDLRRGEEKWSQGVGKHALLYADGHLIVLTESGNLILVEATPNGYHEKGRMKSVLQAPECWALPSLSGGRLYLRDNQHVLCLNLNALKKITFD